jgi:hypothetical protein
VEDRDKNFSFMMPLIAILAGVKTRNFQGRHTPVEGADVRCPMPYSAGFEWRLSQRKRSVFGEQRTTCHRWSGADTGAIEVRSNPDVFRPLLTHSGCGVSP